MPDDHELRFLLPDSRLDELEVAGDTLADYVATVLDIHDRLRETGVDIPGLLTKGDQTVTLKEKESLSASSSDEGA